MQQQLWNFFGSYYKWTRKDNHLLLDIAQPKDGVEYICRGIIKTVVWTMYGHGTLEWSTTIYLLVLFPCILISHKLTCKNQFIYISNTSENWWSDLLALAFLSDSYWSGENRIFSELFRGENHYWFKNRFILRLIIISTIRLV